MDGVVDGPRQWWMYWFVSCLGVLVYLWLVLGWIFVRFEGKGQGLWKVVVLMGLTDTTSLREVE